MKPNEAELLAVAVRHLESQSYDVYAEVPAVIKGQTVVADIVAKGPSGCWHVLEGKRYLDETVIAQAKRWRRSAHYVWAVVSEPRQRSRRHEIMIETCSRMGVGVLYIAETLDRTVRCLEPAKGAPKDIALLQNAVHDDQRPGRSGPAAGVAAARRVKRDRWEAVREYLQGNPGATGKELARECDLSKADQNDLRRLAERGEVRGVRIEPNDVPYTYWLVE